VSQVLVKQLSLLKERLAGKDRDLKAFVETQLQANQHAKDNTQQLKQELEELKQEALADEMRIFDLEREIEQVEVRR
jgi:hypothetical protein